ncbi:hypothetical protein BVG19_g1625 [[Candida] boidinii]|nr:hypothetical protein BVG19_g1625 [[Candida] boidinii]OWB49928.1 hypothetical protein B5S27_g1473 [[Candida] boidinii]
MYGKHVFQSVCFKRFFSRTRTNQIPLPKHNKRNHYEVLGVSINATDKEIKKKFRELSKKYHPDIVNSQTELSPEEKKDKNDKFIELATSYEVLGDTSKKAKYDEDFKTVENINEYRAQQRQEFHDRYYGAAPHEFKSSGLKSSRNRVHYGTGSPYRDKSFFDGQFRGHDKYDVPHFDYDAHLAKNIRQDKRVNQAKATYTIGNVTNHDLAHRNISFGIRKDISSDGRSTSDYYKYTKPHHQNSTNVSNIASTDKYAFHTNEYERNIQQEAKFSIKYVIGMLLFGTLLFSTIGKNEKDKESEIFLKSMKPDNEPTPTSQEKNSSITIKSKTTDKHIKKAAITPVPKTESSEQKPIADNDSDIPLSKHSVSQTEKSSHEDAFTTKPEQKTELQSENKTDKNNYAALLLQTAAKK